MFTGGPTAVVHAFAGKPYEVVDDGYCSHVVHMHIALRHPRGRHRRRGRQALPTPSSSVRASYVPGHTQLTMHRAYTDFAGVAISCTMQL